MPVLEGALLGFSARRHSLEGTCWFILHNFKGCHCWVSAWAVPAILSLQCWLLPLPRSLRYQGLWEALQGSFLEQLQWFRRGCWLTAHISKAGVDGTKLYLNLLQLSCSGWNIFLWWRRGLIDYSLFLNLGALEQGAERKRWEWTGVTFIHHSAWNDGFGMDPPQLERLTPDTWAPAITVRQEREPSIHPTD